ncbi:MAG: hypothetical protein ACREHG_02900, partial [Candidatus Saccharimonadales bacterium]
MTYNEAIMIPLHAIPISSLAWLIGMLACLIIAIKCTIRYKRYGLELSKYMAWFCVAIAVTLSCMSIPSFFTLNLHTLRAFYMVSEVFFYVGMAGQAAIFWCVLLRSYVRLRFVILPILIISVPACVYSFELAYLTHRGNFITYNDPYGSALVIAGMMGGLFIPVGLYFLLTASRQKGHKEALTSMTFGAVYIGVGLVTAVFEIIDAKLMTPKTMFVDLFLFSFLLLSAVWPRHGQSFTGRST